MLRSLIFSLLLFLPSALSAEFQKKPIRVGVIYPFTGIGTHWSEYGKKGLELAKDEINAGGGIHGAPIELLYEDSRGEARYAVTAFRKLVDVDRVEAIVGDLWAYLTNPLIPLSSQKKVLLLSPTVMDRSIEQSGEYFFTMGHKVSSLAASTSLFLNKHPAIKSVSLHGFDEPWSRAHFELWESLLGKRGIEVRKRIIQPDLKDSLRSDATLLTSANSDTVFSTAYGARLLRRFKELNYSPHFLSTSILEDDFNFEPASRPLLEGCFFTSWKPKQEFITFFQGRFNTPPLIESHNHYEALKSLAKALSNPTPSLVEAFKTIHYEGVAGPIDFRTSNSGNYGIAALYTIDRGTLRKID